MLKTLALVALFAGAHAQNAVERNCVAQSNGETYQFCARLLDMNVYWNYTADAPARASFLVEAPDNGWHGFGFSPENMASSGPMLNSDVVLGCSDFTDPQRNGPYPVRLGGRVVADVVAGIDGTNMVINNNITQTRERGLCAMAFERLAVYDGADPDQNLGNADNGVVVARGAANALGQHAGAPDGRAFFLIDFQAGTAAAATPVDTVANNQIVTEAPPMTMTSADPDANTTMTSADPDANTTMTSADPNNNTTSAVAPAPTPSSTDAGAIAAVSVVAPIAAVSLAALLF